MSSERIVTLTTDFGLQDAYVAAMKAAILSRAPGSTLCDISHLVPPQDIAAGSYVLRSAASQFARGTVHLAVVDPGVGTARRAVAVAGRAATFVGPDNGLLIPALEHCGAVDALTGRVTEGVAVVLDAAAFRSVRVSNTFHGRDIFAPAAGWLAAGEGLLSLGPRVTELAVLPQERLLAEDGLLRGHIVYVDHYGNAVTNIPAEMLPVGAVVEVGRVTVDRLSASYRDAPVVALVGSNGTLEISVRDGSAARELGLGPGDQVTVRRAG